MAFNNLKTLKLQDITGSQLAQVGNVFTDTSSKSDFIQLSQIKNAIIDSKTFTGGLPFPDSIKIYSKTASSDTVTIKPSDIYSNDLDVEKYLVKLFGYAITANDASASTDISLTDGATALPILISARAAPLTETDILFNENNYISFTEAGGYNLNFIGLYGIVSRGGV